MHITLTGEGYLYGKYQGEWYPVNDELVLTILTHSIVVGEDVTLRSIFRALMQYPLLQGVVLLSPETLEDIAHLPHWTRSERQPLSLLAIHRQMIAKSSEFTPITQDTWKDGLPKRQVVGIRRQYQSQLTQHVSLSGYREYPGTRYSLQNIPMNTVIEAPVFVEPAALVISDDEEAEERQYDDHVTLVELIAAISQAANIMSIEGRRQIRIIDN